MKCDSYDRILKRITALSPNEQVTVKRIFSWLICARRPLRTVELNHALLIQPGDRELQHERALISDMLVLCGPIVEKRKEYITFIHFSAKEYSHTEMFGVAMFAVLIQCSLDFSPRIHLAVGMEFEKRNRMLKSL